MAQFALAHRGSTLQSVGLLCKTQLDHNASGQWNGHNSSNPRAKPRLKVRISTSLSARYESPEKGTHGVHVVAVSQNPDPVSQLQHRVLVGK